MRKVGVIALLTCACGGSGSQPDARVAADSSGATDASPTCDPTAPFDPPVKVAGLATADGEKFFFPWPDELTAYFSYHPAGSATYDLAVASRASLTAPFGAPTPLTQANSTADDVHPTLMSDGLTMLFHSSRAGDGGQHIYVSSRTATLAAFGAAAEVANINSSTVTDYDVQPFVTRDGEELWFSSNRAGSLGFAIYRADRNGSGFVNPTRVADLDTAADEEAPVLSADKLTIYFAANGAPSAGGFDIWTAHRASATDGFPAASAVTELNTGADDKPSWLSPDNCRLYFTNSTSGSDDIYLAVRHPT